MPTRRALPCLLVWLATGASYGATLSPAARAQIETDWQQQERTTRGQEPDTPAAVTGVLHRGQALAADLRQLGAAAAVAAARERLREVESAHQRLSAAGTPPRAAWLALYLSARWAVRELAFSNPRLDFDRLLFVKRQWPYFNHQCAHRVGEAQIPGANLCVLSGLSPDGTVREVLTGDLAAGGIGRPDLSFDARRVVFPYARPRRPPTGYPSGGGHAGYDPADPTNSDSYRGGGCHMYKLWEVGLDGQGLRQLTHDDRAEDTEPCYLPGGRLCFTSSRQGRLVQCGDWALVFGLWSMAADGSDLRRVGEPQDSEFYPAVLPDGRILYTRWDYVMKPYNVMQPLWSVYPDGRRAELAFGEWFTFSRGPIALFEARPIPGTRQVLAVGAAHHNTGVGPIMRLDLDRNRQGPDGMVNLTPEVGYPECGPLLDERTVRAGQDIAPISNVESATGWYASPYPLSAGQYLVCYSFQRATTVRDGFGLYLQDQHGNKELIHRGQGYSCYAPIPIRPRPEPPALPDEVRQVPPDTPGRLLVQDVYRGLDGVPRGAVKYLRVLEVYTKGRHTNPHRCDVGVNSGWDLRGVLGTVPVAADGSAWFTAPSGRLLMLEALDADHLELKRMRNYLNLMPGETQSCVGCHDTPNRAPAATGRTPLAFQRAPEAIRPPPWGAGPMKFATVVQPVLDRHCLTCHDGSAAAGHAFDLRPGPPVTAPPGLDGDEGPQHSVSGAFLALLPHVSYVRLGGYHGEKLPLPTGRSGSSASRLMALLRAGHHQVKLPPADWQALAAWIDCNAPYYGSYDDLAYLRVAGLLRQPNAADLAAIDARRRELQPADGHLVAYLAGGLQTRCGPERGVELEQLSGQGWNCPGMEQVPGIPRPQSVLTFEHRQLEFALKGLHPQRRYTLGLTWWDYDHGGRRQSVWATATKGRPARRLLPTQELPSWLPHQQRPATVTVPLPAELVREREFELTIAREGGANAVLSEIWLIER